MLQTILLLLHLAAAIGLVTLVLLQHGKGADAGAAFGSGASATVFGARGSGSFLTRATAVLAVVFFLNSLFLAYLSGQNIERRSVVETVAPTLPVAPPAEDAPPLSPDVPSPPR
jgi:preprotein translocase subunit SecG